MEWIINNTRLGLTSYWAYARSENVRRAEPEVPAELWFVRQRKIKNAFQNIESCLLSYLNLLKPTGHVMHQHFNIQQLYVLPTLYLCVLYLSENKQRLVPLTA